jgi:hypothetical protein
MNNKTKSFERECLNNKNEKLTEVFINRRFEGLSDERSTEVFINRRFGCWKCEKPAGGFQWQL